MYANRDDFIRMMLDNELLRVAAFVTCLYFPAFTSCSRKVLFRHQNAVFHFLLVLLSLRLPFSLFLPFFFLNSSTLS
jgi:hypothetical protein